MSKIPLTGTVVEGRVQWDTPNYAKALFKAYEGKRVSITVEKFSRKRTMQQNRYYWGVVIEMIYAAFQDFGTDTGREECHEMLANKFLTVEKVNMRTGEIMHRVRSTTELTTIEFNNYVERIQRYAAETYGIVIPDPIVT